MDLRLRANEAEPGAQGGGNVRGGRADDREIAALERSVGGEARDERVPSGRDRCSRQGGICGTVSVAAQEVEDRPVVPQCEARRRKLGGRDVRDDPADLRRAIGEPSTGDRECTLRDMKTVMSRNPRSMRSSTSVDAPAPTSRIGASKGSPSESMSKRERSRCGRYQLSASTALDA